MKHSSIAIALLFSSIFFSCKTADYQNKPDSFGKDNKNLTIKKTLINPDFEFPDNNFELLINSASLIDSILSVNISYNGCREDNVELVFNGNYLKSYPPRAGVHIVIEPIKEKCDKKVSKTVLFDLSSIKYDNSKTLIVILNDYKDRFTYNY